MPYKDILKRREAQKTYYYKNLKLYKNNKRKQILLKYVNSLKDRPCADYGQRYPTYVMDFDHRDRKQKIISIARAIRDTWSKEGILLEIKKCDLVCSNCHRIRTFGSTN